MKTRNFIPAAMLFWLIIAAFAANGRILWPGEKWFTGVTDVEGLKPVFAQHASAYNRRYLIQALPYFCGDHQVTSLPAWLVREVARAVDDGDPLIVIEGIIAAQKLGLSEMSSNLARTYLRARQMSFDNMPDIHLATAAALAGYNTAASRAALATIVNNPQPAVIVTDVVPALRVLSATGDSTCLGALGALKARALAISDSLSLVKNRFAAMALTTRPDSLRAKADSILYSKANAMAAFVDWVQNKIKERTGVK